jgi:hypothetical protein
MSGSMSTALAAVNSFPGSCSPGVRALADDRCREKVMARLALDPKRKKSSRSDSCPVPPTRSRLDALPVLAARRGFGPRRDPARQEQRWHQVDQEERRRHGKDQERGGHNLKAGRQRGHLREDRRWRGPRRGSGNDRHTLQIDPGAEGTVDAACPDDAQARQRLAC